MPEVVRIKANSLFPMVQEIIEQGKCVRMGVSGTSMYPFLRDGIDSVEFVNVDFPDLSKGDIVLICRKSGAYIMHRVLKKYEDCFYMVGDAQQWIEGPIYKDQVIAKAVAVWRKDRRISVDDPAYRALTQFWLILRPWRIQIISIYKRIKNRIFPRIMR